MHSRRIPTVIHASCPLEIVHRALMLLGHCERRKGPKALPLPSLRIFLAGIQTILAGL